LTPVVLDLFCGEGGASKGYADAGFNVIGVDASAKALKRHPYEHDCLDWREGLERYAGSVDLIHASPPCQHYSVAVPNSHKDSYPDLVGPVRDALIATGIPYVIENVPGAPLCEPAELCGCMFGLGIEYEGKRFAIYRRRLFEASFPIGQWEHRPHDYPVMPVIGSSMPSWFRAKHGFNVPSHVRSLAMRTEWMTGTGTAESIPPVFTECIGTLAIGHIRARGQFDLAA
jgi:DNA (cytosine-5)-methyltransferase 1